MIQQVIERLLLDGGTNLLVYTTTGHVERWNLNEVRHTGQLAKPLSVGNYCVNTTLKHGAPSSAVFNVYHPTPMAVSPDNSRLHIVAGRQFAVLPLGWEEP